MKKRMVIFHNYYTPYRHKFFNLLSNIYNLVVVYLQRPEDEGRKWRLSSPSSYKIVQMRPFYIGKLCLNNPFLRKDLCEADIVVLIDNMPNLVMMVWYLYRYFFLKKNLKIILWTEDSGLGYGESIGRQIYKTILRKFILKRCDELWCWSEKCGIFWNLTYCFPSSKIKILKQTPFLKEDFPNNAVKTKNRVTVFGFIGRLSKNKQVDFLINVMKEVRELGYSFKLLLAGDGELKEKILEGKYDFVTYWGYISGSRKEEFFNSIDFLILPSLKDQWGLVVNEAMKFGVIPIVSDEVGAKEMAVEANGFIFIAGSKESMRKALIKAIKMRKEEFFRRAEKCIQISKEWNLEFNLRKVEEL